GGLTSLLRQSSSRIVMGGTVRSENREIDDREPAADAAPGKPIDIDYDVALVPSRSFAIIEGSLRIRSSSQAETKPPPSATKLRAGAKRTQRQRSDGSYFIRRAGGKIDVAGSGHPVSDKIDEQTPFLATLGGLTEQPYREAQYVAA